MVSVTKVPFGATFLSHTHFGIGEFTTHFRTYFSGWIESDVHLGYNLDFEKPIAASDWNCPPHQGPTSATSASTVAKTARQRPTEALLWFRLALGFIFSRGLNREREPTKSASEAPFALEPWKKERTKQKNEVLS